MRIIGGLYKGKHIKWTDQTTTRPTKDSVRESLFNLIEHSLCFNLTNKRVLDLFSGTGSLVLEALSRGAEWGTFVETNPKVRKVLWENISLLNMDSCSQVIGLKAQTVLARGNTEKPYDLVFLDPPYRLTYLESLITQLTSHEWLHPDGYIVIETYKENSYSPPAGLDLVLERTYGIVKILILKPRF